MTTYSLTNNNIKNKILNGYSFKFTLKKENICQFTNHLDLINVGYMNNMI